LQPQERPAKFIQVVSNWVFTRPKIPPTITASSVITTTTTSKNITTQNTQIQTATTEVVNCTSPKKLITKVFLKLDLVCSVEKFGIKTMEEFPTQFPPPDIEIFLELDMEEILKHQEHVLPLTADPILCNNFPVNALVNKWDKTNTKITESHFMNS